jgi:hypothetical protein
VWWQDRFGSNLAQGFEESEKGIQEGAKFSNYFGGLDDMEA